MSKRSAFWPVIAVLTIIGTVSAYADTPIYQPIPVNAARGFVEVFDSAAGIEYGKARIDYAYWQSGDYWYYTYQIFNNDYSNTLTNPNDDYHFGWLFIDGVTPNPSVYDTIHKFSVFLDPAGTGQGPDDLVVLDTSAGSSAGGGAWGSSPDPGNIGVDWTVSLGSNTPLGIAPSRGQWTRDKGKDVWSTIYAGDTSRSDISGQYFAIASKWAPALRSAAISAGVDKEASGLVMAPGVAPLVVPEPSSAMAMFGAATAVFTLARRRRKTSC